MQAEAAEVVLREHFPEAVEVELGLGLERDAVPSAYQRAPGDPRGVFLHANYPYAGVHGGPEGLGHGHGHGLGRPCRGDYLGGGLVLHPDRLGHHGLVCHGLRDR